MKSNKRPPAIKQAALAFLIAVLFFTFIRFTARTCGFSQLCTWLDQNVQNNIADFPPSQVDYDSRIFLRPLQHILQAFLYIIPFFRTSHLASLFLSILFASLTAGLIMRAVQHVGLPIIVGWLSVLLYLSDPTIIESVISASGVPILIFFLTMTFIHLITWQDKRYWLALVWIGLGTAVAVLTQFNAVFFLILPVLAALVIAYRENPENPNYADNALWIMVTPLVYVFFVRFFFSFTLASDPFVFYQLENEPILVGVVKQMIQPPILPRLNILLRGQLTVLWLTNPSFVVLSAVTFVIALIKRKGFPAVFALMIWIPLLILAFSRQIGTYTETTVKASFLCVSALLIMLVNAAQWKKYHWLFFIPAIILIASWNFFQWLQVV